jgi:hypothetical protein
MLCCKSLLMWGETYLRSQQQQMLHTPLPLLLTAPFLLTAYCSHLQTLQALA